MSNAYHYFHIPVMGTGFSADTPIRVAPFGIDSVISLVDDILLDRLRKHYSEKYGLPFDRINGSVEDGRAKRITAYLDMVGEIVQMRFEQISDQSVFDGVEKRKYFEFLPSDSPLRQDYLKLLKMKTGSLRDSLERELTHLMKPGGIDVNIMVKLDKLNTRVNGSLISDAYSDAKAALRGFANSRLSSAVVFSAGINQSLFNSLTEFKDFYRDETGRIKKKVVLKVSDFRSAFIQGKYLAKKGIEIAEYRIESGLNCGGHAFASNGNLLPDILKVFKEKKDALTGEFQRLAKKYYDKFGWEYPESAQKEKPQITVQGGIGNHGEIRRLRSTFGIDRVGLASPFLLVPEATCVDESTLDILKNAQENDLYLSDVSPIGVPFNNVRNSGSELYTRSQIESGKPGSPCPKGFLKSNTEFSNLPICTASKEYQRQKLDEIDANSNGYPDREKLVDAVQQKSCICDHLGNSALVALGITREKRAPQAVCPGPNIAWFDRIYSLREMIDFIYGRGKSLVPPERPHMFAKEIELYVDYFEKQVAACKNSLKEIKLFNEFRENLENGLKLCLEIAGETAFPGENLESIREYVTRQRSRLDSIVSALVEREKALAAT